MTAPGTRGHAKKGARMASRDFECLFDGVSKMALLDALWCACQLGTDDSNEQIAIQAARNVAAALRERGDRVSPYIVARSKGRIDSDAEGDND